MSSSDDDVPPLEDMSDMLHKVDLLRESKTHNKTENKIDDSKQHSIRRRENGNADINKSENKQVKSSLLKECNSMKTSTLKSNATTEPSKQKSFGGMKKGFLFGSSSQNKPNTNNQSDDRKKDNGVKSINNVDIPLIKPKMSTEEKLYMPEVQEAMKTSQNFMQNKEWVTEDLLTKITKNQSLAKKLEDPKFMQAMTEFQTNPTTAMKKYEQNAEVQSFLKDFCGILGQHFEKLGEDHDEKTPNVTSTNSNNIVTSEAADLSVRSSTNPNQATEEDDKKMQEILSNPETRDILLDPRIQKLIETLRNDPDKAQRALHLADYDLQKKIKKLVECGLLQIQR